MSVKRMSTGRPSLSRKLRRELLAGFAICVAALAVSATVYALLPRTSDRTTVPGVPELEQSEAGNAFGQGPRLLAWEPTGEYRVDASKASMTVYKLNIRPDSVVVLYTFDSAAAEVVGPDTMELSDDLGKKYAVVKNEILGSSQGVTAGVLTTEPYTGGGTTLNLTVSGLRLTGADGTTVGRLDGTWTLQFAKNNEPDREPGYYSGSRISPETVFADDLRIAFDSFQGGFFRLLINRSGDESAIYSERSTGTLRSVSKDEWHRTFAEVNGYPDPGSLPGWPSSEYQPADSQP